MDEESWKALEGATRVVTLSGPLRALVPSLLLSSLPVRTRGLSYEGGITGLAIGAIIAAGSLAIGWILYPLLGALGVVAVFWLLGSAGVVMVISGVRPLAFVKPICVRCRLLPIIKEHEAIHMAGIVSDNKVWASMKTRHSCESLNLDDDPAICSFCPIPKRLREG